MFESTIIKYLDTVKSKDWSIIGILEFAQSNSNTKLSVATLNDFKEDLYSILSSYNDKCNVHVLAKNKVAKILSKFNSSFSTAEVKQFIKDLEYHEEARINITSTYTATVLRDQQENQILIDQLREKSNSEKGKECEKITRPLDEEDDDHSYKRQCKDEGLSDLIEVLDDEEPFIEWELDIPKPSWLDKIAHKRDSLIYIASDCNNKMTHYKLSLKIIDLSDPTIMTLVSEDELSELNTKFSSLLENWTTLEPEAKRCLQSLEKLDNDQLRTIGEIVRPKGTYGAILELQKLLKNKKEQNASELDNLFEDENDFNKEDNGDHKEILSLTLEDHTNPDIAFIFDLIRYISEVVSRASRNRQAEAINAPSNAEGYHLDWMFMGREFSLCEHTGSKMEDMPKILLNTLKVQKTLRDMHRTLIEAISAEGGGILSKPVLQAGTKLLMPGFLSSYFLFVQYLLSILKKFSVITEAEKNRWTMRCFYRDLERDIRFYRGRIESKEDPRKYREFLTDQKRLVSEELLHRIMVKSGLSTAWLMEE
ncbi:8122_t:CDS:2 [Gigaspora margarita]|uniref:8122_t:CDS:1 n=1 Tax=Gigaspora margarita TaxID=4874 RepID=A0ABN7V2T7_GIGMA|nr:8122_t:CDS:2 [Gigaspora margarita]